MYRIMGKFVVFILIIVFIISCATGVESLESKLTTVDRPEWMDSFPFDDDYYIGIAGSNTGNESDDKKNALVSAQADVAASISVKIHRKIEILKKEDPEGNFSSSAKDEITAVVTQSLSGIEIIDTYYSKVSGFWVYIRLSKAEWERIIIEEKAALISRINEFLSPVLSDFNRSLVTKIQELIKARNLIEESTYSGMLKTTFLGESGSFIDIINSNLKQHLDSISLSIKPEKIEIEAGKSSVIYVSVSSNMSSSIGHMPLSVISEEGGMINSFVTDQKGTSKSEIKSSELLVGKNHVILTIDKAAIGFDDSVQTMLLPKKVIIVDVQTIPIGLEVVTPENINIYGIEGTVKSLFSARNLPFKIGSIDSPFIKFDIRISDFPKYLENALYMTQASVVISLVKKGKTIYSFESDQFKDGGLTPEQAHQRVIVKLIKGLETKEYVKGIVEAIGLN